MELGLLQTTTELSNFQRACILNDAFSKGRDRLLSHWDAAEDFAGFLGLIKADPELAKHQATGVLLKDDPEFIANQLNPESTFFLYAEGGSVRFKAGNAFFDVPNGIGDGTVVFSIVDRANFNDHAFNMVGTIKGSFYACVNDYTDSPGIQIEGDCFIYVNSGVIVLQPMYEQAVAFKDLANLRVSFDEVKRFLLSEETFDYSL